MAIGKCLESVFVGEERTIHRQNGNRTNDEKEEANAWWMTLASFLFFVVLLSLFYLTAVSCEGSEQGGLAWLFTNRSSPVTIRYWYRD
eukprot:scaffold426_cov219-Amphora_coffeaeformis.AAC.58